MAPSPSPSPSPAPPGHRDKGKGTLSSVVSSLVRAQYGLAARETTAGGQGESATDLDRHVAELLLQEAKEREERARRENASAWRLSDDDGDEQYQSKTNKRFLKNVLRGVEGHNDALRKQQDRAAELDAIRQREREAREKRTGVRDADRTHRRGVDADASEGNEASAPSTSRSRAGSSGEGGGRRRPALGGGPGFAARSLAIGLSDAVDARRERGRRNETVRSAVDEARARAGDTSRPNGNTSTTKGKERERDTRGRNDAHEGDGNHSKSSRNDRGRESRKEPRRRSPSRSRSRSPKASCTDSGKSMRLRKDQDKDYEDNDYIEERSSATSHRRSHRRDNDDDELDREHRTRSRHSRSPEGEYARRSRTEGSDARASEKRTSRTKKARTASTSSARSETKSAVSSDSSDTFIDTTELASNPSGTSKMDKYFSSSYNPALDVSVSDLTDPATGLIAEGNFPEWDKMLSVLKQRKVDRASGLSSAREEEREKQLRRAERQLRREEREARRQAKKSRKKKKKRRRGSDEKEGSSGSDDSVGPKQGKAMSPVGTVLIDGFEYGKRGSTRAWDLGKEGL